MKVRIAAFLFLLNISIKLLLPKDCSTCQIHCVVEALAIDRVEHRYNYLQ